MVKDLLFPEGEEEDGEEGGGTGSGSLSLPSGLFAPWLIGLASLVVSTASPSSSSSLTFSVAFPRFPEREPEPELLIHLGPAPPLIGVRLIIGTGDEENFRRLEAARDIIHLELLAEVFGNEVSKFLREIPEVVVRVIRVGVTEAEVNLRPRLFMAVAFKVERERFLSARVLPVYKSGGCLDVIRSNPMDGLARERTNQQKGFQQGIS